MVETLGMTERVEFRGSSGGRGEGEDRCDRKERRGSDNKEESVEMDGTGVEDVEKRSSHIMRFSISTVSW